MLEARLGRLLRNVHAGEQHLLRHKIPGLAALPVLLIRKAGIPSQRRRFCYSDSGIARGQTPEAARLDRVPPSPVPPGMSTNFALQQAIRIFPANPMGRAHDLLQPDNVAQRRRAWAWRSVAGANAPTSVCWSLLYMASRTTELARPLTRGVDALCGNGSRGGGVARSGLQSDAWLPAQVMKAVGLAAAVGAGMGAVVGWLTGAPQAAHRSATAGAVVGGALCWAVNQGLALVGLIVKLQVLKFAAVMAAVTILLEPQERMTQTLTADLVGFVPMALAQAAKSAWRGVCNGLRAAA